MHICMSRLCLTLNWGAVVLDQRGQPVLDTHATHKLTVVLVGLLFVYLAYAYKRQGHARTIFLEEYIHRPSACVLEVLILVTDEAGTSTSAALKGEACLLHSERVH